MPTDIAKILKVVRRVRSAYAAKDQDLEQLERELEAIQDPGPVRKRQNLKDGRVEHYARQYSSGKWSKPPAAKKKN